MRINNKRRELLVKELNVMLNKLLANREMYFDKNLILNSEGMKLFSRIAKILTQLYPELRYLINKIREEPSYEFIVKLISRIDEIQGQHSNT